MGVRSIVPEPTLAIAPLTDAAWELVKPLMPPQKPPSGRPRRDHRTVLAGMLWVLSNGSWWRDLPQEEFGPWQTIYGRYRKWRKEGLWQRITEALRC
jgi:transposase